MSIEQIKIFLLFYYNFINKLIKQILGVYQMIGHIYYIFFNLTRQFYELNVLDFMDLSIRFNLKK